MQECPVCKGEGMTIGLFPLYADHVPPEKRKPVIELTCDLCEGKGQIATQTFHLWNQGRAMREDRLKRGMSLRNEAKRLGILPSVLSARERGIRN